MDTPLDAADGSPVNALYVDNDGEVGIGTTNPGDKLEVNGNIGLIGNNAIHRSVTGRYGESSGWQPDQYGSAGLWLESGDGESGGFFANGNTAVIWSPGDSGNNLLTIHDEDVLPNWDPRFEFKNWGDLYIDGTLYASSDVRFKENIVPIDNALEKVLAIEGVFFNRIPDEENPEPLTEVGVIAQNVQTVLPEAINEDSSGYLSVNYSGLAAVLIQAIKEQQGQIEALTAEVEALKARLGQ